MSATARQREDRTQVATPSGVAMPIAAADADGSQKDDARRGAGAGLALQSGNSVIEGRSRDAGNVGAIDTDVGEFAVVEGRKLVEVAVVFAHGLDEPDNRVQHLRISKSLAATAAFTCKYNRIFRIAIYLMS